VRNKSRERAEEERKMKEKATSMIEREARVFLPWEGIRSRGRRG